MALCFVIPGGRASSTIFAIVESIGVAAVEALFFANAGGRASATISVIVESTAVSFSFFAFRFQFLALLKTKNSKLKTQNADGISKKLTFSNFLIF